MLSKLRLSEWFSIGCGLKQGCSPSSMFFNLYINDLIETVNTLEVGTDINDEKIDISVLLAENEDELQY